MQKLVQALFRVLGVVAPRLGGKLAYVLFFKPFRVKLRPKEEDVKQTGKEHSVVVEGKKCYYTVWGEGPAIILSHGWSSKGLHYHKFVEPLLQQGFQVVIPDFPAHVRSEGSSTNILQFKAMLLELLNRHPNTVAMVGHSLGAMANILTLADYPKKLEKMVIVNSAIRAETIMDRYMTQIAGNDRIKDRLYIELQQQFGQDFLYFSTAKRIHDIKQLPKMMVVVDDKDPDAPLNEGTEMAEQTNSLVHVTEGLGHNRGLKDDNVVEQVVQFLA